MLRRLVLTAALAWNAVHAASSSSSSSIAPVSVDAANTANAIRPAMLDLAPELIALDAPISLTTDVTTYEIQPTTNSATTTAFSVYFDNLKLLDGDTVVLHGDNGVDITITHSATAGYWSSPLPSTSVTVEFIPSISIDAATRAAKATDFAVTLVSYRRWDSTTAATAKMCATDQSQPLKCMLIDDQASSNAYLASQAVARVLVNGSIACTGMILGHKAYFLTSAQCIASTAAAQNAVIEFGAESGGCENECQVPMGCSGGDLLRNSELFAVNEALDYAILKLDTTTSDVVAKYGYLTLRDTGATESEEIFITHHPNAYAKRISITNNDGVAPITAFTNLDVIQCAGDPVNHIGYAADAVPGSYGAPVIAVSDRTIVGMHRCGGCGSDGQSSGLNAKAIVDDLAAQGKNRADFLASGATASTTA